MLSVTLGHQGTEKTSQNDVVFSTQKRNTFAYLPTNLHQHNGAPVRAQYAGNVRAQSIAGFVVPEESMPPADDSEHLVV